MQLIDDKKVLSERCEQLVLELKELDKKYKTRLKTLEDNHTAELAKIKQVSAAADKLRREKWRAEETQRIKESTVKSLEPEIQRIIAKGKAEIQKLKAIHEAELLQSDERASRRFVAQMEELRAQCAEEKELACAHERELARQRYITHSQNSRNYSPTYI
jgi:5-azacytidine-induced protein 1